MVEKELKQQQLILFLRGMSVCQLTVSLQSIARSQHSP